MLNYLTSTNNVSRGQLHLVTVVIRLLTSHCDVGEAALYASFSETRHRIVGVHVAVLVNKPFFKEVENQIAIIVCVYSIC